MRVLFVSSAAFEMRDGVRNVPGYSGPTVVSPGSMGSGGSSACSPDERNGSSLSAPVGIGIPNAALIGSVAEIEYVSKASPSGVE